MHFALLTFLAAGFLADGRPRDFARTRAWTSPTGWPVGRTWSSGQLAAQLGAPSAGGSFCLFLVCPEAGGECSNSGSSARAPPPPPTRLAESLITNKPPLVAPPSHLTIGRPACKAKRVAENKREKLVYAQSRLL